MPLSVIFFDLDDTLYPSATNLWPLIRERMSLYMTERLGLPAADVPALRRQYYETYGTTLRGLQAHHHVDADDYLAFVHDIPLADYIQPNPALRRMLLSLPQRRFIFTNADAAHAWRVMRQVGVEDCFESIIDIRALNWLCKPEPGAYQQALALVGDPAPSDCLMLDDAPANLAPARALGFTTVLISHELTGHPAATHTTRSLMDLPHLLPGLWEVPLF